jgi:hypothetical protein
MGPKEHSNGHAKHQRAINIQMIKELEQHPAVRTG